MIFKNKIIPSLIAINLLLITTSSISVAEEDKRVISKDAKNDAGASACKYA